MNEVRLNDDMCEDKHNSFKLVRYKRDSVNVKYTKIKIMLCNRIGTKKRNGNVIRLFIKSESKKICSYGAITRKLNIRRRNNRGKLRVIN